jgi:hypothetical protein
MQQISDALKGTILIFDKFDTSSAIGSANETPAFNAIGDEYVLSFTNLEKVKRFTKFIYDTLGMNTTRYLNNYYRVSRDGVSYTTWFDLKRNIDNFPAVDPNDQLFIDIKWVRSGSSSVGSIRILEYAIEGDLERDLVEDGSAIQLKPGKSTILKAPFIYKVFKIEDVEVLSKPETLENVLIKYRYSQDSSKTWSNWEYFSKENLSTIKINPIRFFQIEYYIENNSSENVSIQDINLIGDFQNVSKDYFKSNLFGIRECCQSNMTGYTNSDGVFVPASGAPGVSGGISGDSCSGGTSNLPAMTDAEKANLYNPYQQNTAISLLTKLSTDAQQIFGHKVIYFATDADKKGQDHILNEYQLYNVVCDGTIKVSVEGNNFPDSQIVMNQFDLNLFQTMEVHITKQQFKEVFGPQRRPAKEDFLYFCDVNRMYTVDHAQQFRNFNNAAVYYKLILKKYNKRANVDFTDADISDTVKQLTKNSTIDELFGAEIAKDKDAVANKPQHRTLSKDPIRLEYFAEIDKELIENSSTIISKSNYDLSTVDFGSTAVKYKNFAPHLKVSDNFALQIWFKLNNYILDEVYNFFSFYDIENSLGWKVNFKNDTVTVVANSDSYEFNLMNIPTNDTVSLEEDVWYCYVLNVNQRERKMEQYVYKRDVEEEGDASSLPSNLLRLVYEDTRDFVPFEFLNENDTCEILASDMRITNIRLFSDVIPKSYHNKMLNQYVVGEDSKYLILADNANTRIILPNFPLN